MDGHESADHTNDDHGALNNLNYQPRQFVKEFGIKHCILLKH